MGWEQRWQAATFIWPVYKIKLLRPFVCPCVCVCLLNENLGASVIVMARFYVYVRTCNSSWLQPCLFLYLSYYACAGLAKQ